MNYTKFCEVSIRQCKKRFHVNLEFKFFISATSLYVHIIMKDTIKLMYACLQSVCIAILQLKQKHILLVIKYNFW